MTFEQLLNKHRNTTDKRFRIARLKANGSSWAKREARRISKTIK